MRKRAIPAALLLLALLAGCGPLAELLPDPTAPDPGGSPSPAVSSAPAAGPQVEVHWDALGEHETGAAAPRRLSPGWLDDFTPGRYGQIIPYIGGEQAVRYDYGDDYSHYEAQYLYGLCTTDGLILTDPVFNAVYRMSWYDYTRDADGSVPVWAVSRVLRDEGQAGSEWSKGYYTAVGLVAADGSWYTGTRFQSGASSTIAVSPYSILMMEDADNAVLISTDDGSELTRYSPYDFLGPEDPNGVASWLFADGLQWGMVRCVGGYLYCDPAMSGGMMEGDPIWIDAKTGAFLDEPPMEQPEYQYAGKITFDGGWYEDIPADDQPGDLVLHYDDGSEEVIHLDGSLGSLSNVTRTRLIFYRADATGDSMNYTLTDHELNVLYDGEDTAIFLSPDGVTGRQWLVAQTLLDEKSYAWRYTVLDEMGRALVSSDAYLSIDGGLASVVDGGAYRLVDLEHGGREIFRLPRFTALDVNAQ